MIVWKESFKKRGLRQEMSTIHLFSFKTNLNLSSRECTHVWVCLSPLSEMSKVPTHETRGNSSWITPAPADLNCRWKTERSGTWWDSHERQSMMKMSEYTHGGTEHTSQLLMSRCKSEIWGLLDRPRNRALKENTGRGRIGKGEREQGEAKKQREKQND